jgi:3-hydroxyisobutyrate dehydrogenase-like beta-hydroxyacid dehydrogenase
MGQTMKLANNMLSATAMAASSEVMVMGVKAGLDPNVMIEVIKAGSGLNTAIRDKFPRAILPGTFDYDFSNGLMYKDLRLCNGGGGSNVGTDVGRQRGQSNVSAFD